MKHYRKARSLSSATILSLSLAALFHFSAPGELQAQTAFNPFFLISDRADFHLMAYFDGHPEYEAVEAYVYQTGYPAEQPAIRAIITRHGGEQEDYVNSERPGTLGVKRVRHTSEISVRRAANGKDWFLDFRLADGQDCALVYIASSPPGRAHGGLTDVGFHSADGGLPLFWRESSGMGGKASHVRIGETRYRVSPDPSISKPPFFYGYKAYLTLGMAGMILPTGDFALNLPMEAEAALPRPALSWIAGAAADMGISFTPALPDWRELKIGEGRNLGFSIDFPGAKGACTGSVMVDRLDETHATVRVSPEKPAWAARTRRLLYRIEDRPEGELVSCRMAELQP